MSTTTIDTATDTATTGIPQLSYDHLNEDIKALVADLAAKYPHAGEEQVAAMVAASAKSLAGARITEFIPVLIGQEVDRQLRATAPRLAG